MSVCQQLQRPACLTHLPFIVSALILPFYLDLSLSLSFTPLPTHTQTSCQLLKHRDPRFSSCTYTHTHVPDRGRGELSFVNKELVGSSLLLWELSVGKVWFCITRPSNRFQSLTGLLPLCISIQLTSSELSVKYNASLSFAIIFFSIYIHVCLF